MDFRQLNAASTLDAYLMPWIDALLHQVSQAHYLATLELSKAYWQIPGKGSVLLSSPVPTLMGLIMKQIGPDGGWWGVGGDKKVLKT